MTAIERWAPGTITIAAGLARTTRDRTRVINEFRAHHGNQLRLQLYAFRKIKASKIQEVIDRNHVGFIIGRFSRV
jgi:hypothetical protein